MKKVLSLSLCLLMLLMSSFAIVSCGGNEIETGTRLYNEDTTLGEGATTFTFVVVHSDGDTITFTINTDKITLGEALLDAGVVSGEDSGFGLFVQSVNGTSIDYEASGGYFWALYEGEDAAATGVSSITIDPSITYSFRAQNTF